VLVAESQPADVTESSDSEAAATRRARAVRNDRMSFDILGPGEVAFRGEIDLANAPDVHRVLEEIGGGDSLVVDLTGVGYLGSPGVAELFEHAETNSMTVRVMEGSPTARVLQICSLEIVATIEIVPAPANPSQIPARSDRR
jgi:anti-anti-sigma factor